MTHYYHPGQGCAATLRRMRRRLSYQSIWAPSYLIRLSLAISLRKFYDIFVDVNMVSVTNYYNANAMVGG